MAFSERLQQTLHNANYADSPTQLAREFNLRYAGSHVTVHAVRKWLVGDAIPTQEKLRTLADWLGVSAEWLRFGGEDAAVKGTESRSAERRLDRREVTMLELYRLLDEKHQTFVVTTIRQLVLASNQN
jgi:transcriptional regulator with XRE-family HTH domain